MATKSNIDTLDSMIQKANKELGAETKMNAPKATVQTVEAQAARQYNELEAKRKSLVNFYRNETKVPVTISPFYAPYLGRVVRVSVNGIVVDIPADGQTYNINKTHADHIVSKIKRIDAMIARQKRAGDVSNNFEHAPGELHL